MEFGRWLELTAVELANVTNALTKLILTCLFATLCLCGPWLLRLQLELCVYTSTVLRKLTISFATADVSSSPNLKWSLKMCHRIIP